MENLYIRFCVYSNVQIYFHHWKQLILLEPTKRGEAGDTDSTTVKLLSCHIRYPFQQNGIAMTDHISLQDALRLLSINQIAIAAAVEELALWAKQQGADEAFQHVHDCLSTLDENSRLLTIAIEGTDRFATTN